VEIQHYCPQSLPVSTALPVKNLQYDNDNYIFAPLQLNASYQYGQEGIVRILNLNML